MMDLANEADTNYDFASNTSGCFHFVKKKLSSVPKIEIDWLTFKITLRLFYALLVIRRFPPPVRPEVRSPHVACDYRLVNTCQLKDFRKPYDFVLAPVVLDKEENLDEEANKPILVTLFAKASEEWPRATYFNVRTGKACRITYGGIHPKGRYCSAVLPFDSQCLCIQCRIEIRWTRRKAMLQLDSRHGTHVVAGEHRYCGKVKRKLEQGPVDHEGEFNCKVYQNGRVVAGPESLRQLASFSERQLEKQPAYVATRSG